MTRYILLTTIFAVIHAGRTKTKPQNRANTTQMKTEVLTLPEQKLKSISSSNSSLKISPAQSDTSNNGLTSSIKSNESSQERIRELEVQLAKKERQLKKLSVVYLYPIIMYKVRADELYTEIEKKDAELKYLSRLNDSLPKI